MLAFQLLLNDCHQQIYANGIDRKVFWEIVLDIVLTVDIFAADDPGDGTVTDIDGWYYPVERINAFVIFPMIALYHHGSKN